MVCVLSAKSLLVPTPFLSFDILLLEVRRQYVDLNVHSVSRAHMSWSAELRLVLQLAVAKLFDLQVLGFLPAQIRLVAATPPKRLFVSKVSPLADCPTHVRLADWEEDERASERARARTRAHTHTHTHTQSKLFNCECRMRCLLPPIFERCFGTYELNSV